MAGFGDDNFALSPAWSGFDGQEEVDLDQHNKEKAVTSLLKPAAEVKALCLAPELKGIARIKHVIRKRESGVTRAAKGLQLLGICERLQQLHGLHPKEDFGDIISWLKRPLRSLNDEQVLISAGEAVAAQLRTLSQTVVEASDNFAKAVLPLINEFVTDERSGVARPWLEAMAQCITGLDVATLNSAVLPILQDLCNMTRPESCRKACCSLCSALVVRQLDEFYSAVLVSIKALCRDVAVSVRVEMCENLGRIFNSFSPEDQRDVLLPEIIELSTDEEAEVQHAAFTAIVSGFPHLHLDSQKSTSVLLLDLYQPKGTKAPVHTELATYLVGRAAFALLEIASKEEMELMFRYFFTLVDNSNPPKSRRIAAFNLPAMFHVFSKTAPDPASKRDKEIAEQLIGTLTKLTHDEDTNVRCTVATSLHEICRLDLKGWFSLIKIHLSCLTDLLRDQEVRVVEAIAWKLSLILQHLSDRLAANNVDGSCWLPLEILTALRQCEVTLGANWRPRLSLLKLIPQLSQFFTPNQVFAKSAPWLTGIILANDPRPQSAVQQTALQSAALLLRCTPREEQRAHFEVWMVSELAEGHSAWFRMLFVDLCTHLMNVFSRNYFKEHFFEALLELGRDTVAEVRIKLCRMAGRLKRALSLPLDRPLLKLLETVFGRICVGMSSEALKIEAKEAVQALDAINIDSIWGDGENRDDDPQVIENRKRYAAEQLDFAKPLGSKVDKSAREKWRRALPKAVEGLQNSESRERGDGCYSADGSVDRGVNRVVTVVSDSALSADRGSSAGEKGVAACRSLNNTDGNDTLSLSFRTFRAQGGSKRKQPLLPVLASKKSTQAAQPTPQSAHRSSAHSGSAHPSSAHSSSSHSSSDGKRARKKGSHHSLRSGRHGEVKPLGVHRSSSEHRHSGGTMREQIKMGRVLPPINGPNS